MPRFTPQTQKIRRDHFFQLLAKNPKATNVALQKSFKKKFHLGLSDTLLRQWRDEWQMQQPGAPKHTAENPPPVGDHQQIDLVMLIKKMTEDKNIKRVVIERSADERTLLAHVEVVSVVSKTIGIKIP